MVNQIVYLGVGDGIFGILYFVFLNGDFDEDTMLGPSYSLTCSCYFFAEKISGEEVELSAD